MEEKINIAEILKDKPVGLELYSPTFGCIRFNGIYKDKVYFYSEDTNAHSVNQYGKMYDGGECIIFPSKEMRDWSKFAWKKGDVLVSKHGTTEVIFDCFDDDIYTSFKGKHALKTIEGKSEYKGESDDGYGFYSENYHLESEDAAQTYINTIEERLGGKLNCETLEIEKQPEFKDGDVVAVDEIPFNLYSKCIFILKENLNTGEIKARAYVLYNVNNDSIFFDTPVMKVIERNIHLATDEEKQRLFDALAKEGKHWDAKKKAIVDLPKKCEFKAFDKVLVRDSNDYKWKAGFFSHYSEGLNYPFICVGGGYGQCIPYNEETAHLLGTTDEWKGGEG